MKQPEVLVRYIHPIMEKHGLTYATDGSNAVDVRCMEDIVISTSRTKMIKLGFALAIPKGYAAILLPRSGLGSKYGVEMNNTIGLIDEDYRGELQAALRLKPMGMELYERENAIYNKCEINFKAGERIAQLAIVPIPQATFTPVDELPTTVRGSNGHGSTGT